MYTAEDCRRKADQHWEMAGLVRMDRDTADADRHTREARLWETRASQGGHDPRPMFRISIELSPGLATAVQERIAGCIAKTVDHVWRLGDTIFIDTMFMPEFITDYYADGFDYDFDVCELPT